MHRTGQLLCLAVVALSSPAAAQQQTAPPALFQRMVGRWVLRGTIANQPTTHDVDAELVLNGGYVQLHEVSREKDAQGRPAYEAIVFIGVDKTGAYSCLWLDNTGTWGLTPEALGHATPSGNSIPFVFDAGDGVFHNTFTYLPERDAWQWTMDNESAGHLQPFGRVTLTRQ
jgi:hypothetical protein